MRQDKDKTNTEFNGDKRGPECQKSSFLRLKRKKEGESAFSDFIGFYFIYRIVGIYGFYPGIGRIIHPSLPPTARARTRTVMQPPPIAHLADSRFADG